MSFVTSVARQQALLGSAHDACDLLGGDDMVLYICEVPSACTILPA